MSMNTSSPMGCMLHICIHQALVAEEVIHEGKNKIIFEAMQAAAQPHSYG